MFNQPPAGIGIRLSAAAEVRVKQVDQPAEIRQGYGQTLSEVSGCVSESVVGARRS